MDISPTAELDTAIPTIELGSTPRDPYAPADLSTAVWRKISKSSGGLDCVEVAFPPGGVVGVRGSKNAAGPALLSLLPTGIGGARRPSIPARAGSPGRCRSPGW
ncbi:DUF397 domain-containing protein [Nocardia mexicana]|uniref:DUF397 domain-containing protein n=1 Tax=Nocardia mexicana TaxID=279262 RepID=UPI0027D92CEB|nr:DUF397 domain-containing protein [Nocardia mexicana]